MSLRREHHAEARGLRTELEAITTFVPRREDLTLWLDALIARTAVSGSPVQDSDGADLADLRTFLAACRAEAPAVTR